MCVSVASAEFSQLSLKVFERRAWVSACDHACCGHCAVPHTCWDELPFPELPLTVRWELCISPLWLSFHSVSSIIKKLFNIWGPCGTAVTEGCYVSLLCFLWAHGESGSESMSSVFASFSGSCSHAVALSSPVFLVVPGFKTHA